MRAYSPKSSTIAFIAATWLMMVSVARASASRSGGASRSASFACTRSAESWIGVSGFLISCASRRATSPQAVARCAAMSWLTSSNTTT